MDHVDVCSHLMAEPSHVTIIVSDVVERFRGNTARVTTVVLVGSEHSSDNGERVVEQQHRASSRAATQSE